MTLTRNWTLSLIGFELLLAGAMAIGYIAFIQPTAPRYHRAAVAKVVLPTAVETIAVAPAPVIVARVAAPIALSVRPKVTPAKARAIPAAPAAKTLPPVVLPTPVSSPIPTRIPPPVQAPVQVKLSPDELIRRGMVSLNAGQWPSAIESFDAARKLQPNNPDLGYLSGMALENLGQPGAAIDAFRSCTSGPYAQIAKGHVRMLISKLKR